MEESKVLVEVYVGLMASPVVGGWVKLPQPKEELVAKLADFGFGDREIMICDVNTDLPTEFYSYRDPLQLNQDLMIFKVYEERGQLPLLMTAYEDRDFDLESAIDWLETGNYQFYEGVENETSLGEAVVSAGLFGWLMVNPDAHVSLPEVKQLEKRNLLQTKLVKQYLDYESIGNDWICNGCKLYPKMKTAIMETRQER